MLRRRLIQGLCAGVMTIACAAAEALKSLRGKLSPGARPSLVGDRGSITLTGDPATMLVLADQRLKDMDFEAVGEQAGEPGVFRVGPLHKRSMFIHQGGKRLMVTYWCAVCSIRTFTPGVCMCCQDDTAVDLVEKLDSDDLRTR
jgi:hypothetical protein